MSLYQLWLILPFIGLYLCAVALGWVWERSRLLAIPTAITLLAALVAVGFLSAFKFLEGVTERDRAEKEIKRMENAEKKMGRIEGKMTDTERERMLKIIDTELERRSK